MEREAADAAYARLHEKRRYHDGTFRDWSETASAEHPYQFNAGVTIGLADSDLRPWDAFLTEEDASPSGRNEVDEDDDDRDGD